MQRIRAEIERGGPLTYDRFMEMALYEPGLGYYLRCPSDPAAGPVSPDFQTSPEVHPAFGELIARFLEMVWQWLGRPDPLVIVEPGAGAGELAHQIAGALAELTSGGEPIRFRYHAVDPGYPVRAGAMRSASRAAGEDQWPAGPIQGKADGISWWRSLDDLVAAGVRAHAVISNEFFDALPVHRVAWIGGRLREIFVDWSGRGFVERLGEPSDPALIEWISASGIVPPEGWRGEICLRLRQIWWSFAALIWSGVVLSIDYGDDTASLLGARWYDGTLLAYHRHHWNDELLSRIGEQDLTSQVDFGALVRLGREHGFQPVFRTTQRAFLQRLQRPGDVVRWIASAPSEARRWEAQLALAELMRPDGLGRLTVLLQQRGQLAGDPAAWWPDASASGAGPV